MTAWERYWFDPVAAIRPYVLERTVLFLLAFDAWLQFVPHGARYGAGGFNVAHFAWLDAIQPLPSPQLHVGLMLIVGGLAWVLACVGGPRWLRALLLVLYTYGWAMSRMDAYQHHYLLSLLLGAFVFFPELQAADLLTGGNRRMSAWAYVLVAANVAIVYVFAAVTKTDAGWASGGVLRAITTSNVWFRAVWRWVLATGAREDVLWALLARSVALMQLLIAFAFLAGVRADASPRRWIRVLGWVGFAAAVGFHGSLLLFQIDIRWFSYYMMAIAAAVFLPEPVLRRLVGIVTVPLRRARTRGLVGDGWSRVGIATLAAAVVVLVSSRIDLPGAIAAGIVCGLAVVAAGVVAGRASSARPRRVSMAAATGALVLAAAVNVVPIRFQYYLYVVADLQRRGDSADVLAAYEKAEQYAPHGQSRQAQIDALRSRLATGRIQ